MNNAISLIPRSADTTIAKFLFEKTSFYEELKTKRTYFKNLEGAGLLDVRH